jgi:hypothetical protein
MPTEYPRASAVRETLRAKLPHIDAGVRGAVLCSMIEAGHLQNDLSEDHLYAGAERTQLSPMRAAATQPRRFAEVAGLCRSLGLYIDPASDKKLSLQEIDKCFAGKDVDQRARAKTALYQLNLIEA